MIDEYKIGDWVYIETPIWSNIGKIYKCHLTTAWDRKYYDYVAVIINGDWLWNIPYDRTAWAHFYTKNVRKLSNEEILQYQMEC
jgi:hypothetical protein